jgi:hypothetical protein
MNLVIIYAIEVGINQKHLTAENRNVRQPADRKEAQSNIIS